MTANPLKLDPARISGPRRSLLAGLRQRLGVLRKRFSALLTGPAITTEQVGEWLKEQPAKVLVGEGGSSWFATLLIQVYTRAASRVWERLSQRRGRGRGGRTRGVFGPLTEASRETLKQEFLRRLLARKRTLPGPRPARNFSLDLGGADPETVVGQLVARMRLELTGLASTFSQEATRILLDGIARGLSTRDMATAVARLVDGKLASRVKAIVQTELIRINAEALLDAAEDFAESGMEVVAVWVADENACDYCESKDGETYEIDEARGLIPLHVACACTWEILVNEEYELGGRTTLNP